MPSRPVWLPPGERLATGGAVALALVPLLGAVVLAFGRGGYVVDSWGPWATISLLALTVAVCAGITARPAPAQLAAPACLAALGLWSLVSGVWSPFPQTALVEGARELWYAAVMALAVLLLYTRGRRRLAVAAVGLASAAVALGHVAIVLAGPDPAEMAGGRLVGSIGYGGGLACAVGIGIWPLVALASDRAAPLAAQGAAAAGLGAALATIIATQARAGLWSTIAAGAVYLLLVPARGRALALLLAPAAAVAVSWDALNATFTTRGLAPSQYTVTGRAMAAVAVASLIGWLATAAGGRWLPAGVMHGRLRLLAVGARVIAATAAVILGLAVVAGGPVQRLESLWDSFRQPDGLRSQSSRFGTLSTDRYDLWRVGLLAFARQPLTGVGAASFSGIYQRERRSGQQVQQAHSEPIEILATVGYPGFLLLVAASALPLAAAVRLARSGLTRDRLLGAALAAALSGFTIQTAVDWNWHIAAAAVPAMTLAGAALARPSRLARAPTAVIALTLIAVAIAIAIVVPATLAQRYLKRSYAEAPAQALRDARNADRLDAFSGRPQVALARAHLRAGDARAAVAAAVDATDAEPEWWVAWQVLAVAAARDGRFELEARALRRVRSLAPMLPPRQQGVMPSVDFDHY